MGRFRVFNVVGKRNIYVWQRIEKEKQNMICGVRLVMLEERNEKYEVERKGRERNKGVRKQRQSLQFTNSLRSSFFLPSVLDRIEESPNAKDTGISATYIRYDERHDENG